MLGPGRQALHRVCDSVSGVNWRPTRFVDELMLTRYACCVCHVIPTTTVVLPCFHALCEECQAGCVVEDGGSVCPLDGEPFSGDECDTCHLSAQKKRNLKAHCWNEVYGCDFVGPLAAILGHFEAECSFHAFPCQRCGENVRNAELAAHYIGGCRNALPSVALAESSRQNGAVVTSSDDTAVGREVEKPVTNTCEDDMPALQSQVNELRETARIQGAQLQELNAALAASLETMNANVALVAERFSETIGVASEMQQRMLAWKAEESCLAREGGASSSVERKALPECMNILRNLQHFAGESVECLERLFQLQTQKSHPIVQVFLLPRRIDEPMEGCSDSSSSSCVKVNETIYRMIVYDLSRNREGYIGLPRLHRRDAQFSVTFTEYTNTHRRTTTIYMNFTWSYKKENFCNLPKVVRVTKVSGDNFRDLSSCGIKDFEQSFLVGDLRDYDSEKRWIFEIAIHN